MKNMISKALIPLMLIMSLAVVSCDDDPTATEPEITIVDNSTVTTNVSFLVIDIMGGDLSLKWSCNSSDESKKMAYEVILDDEILVKSDEPHWNYKTTLSKGKHTLTIKTSKDYTVNEEGEVVSLKNPEVSTKKIIVK